MGQTLNLFEEDNLIIILQCETLINSLIHFQIFKFFLNSIPSCCNCRPAT
ncbi:hypothetical protein HanIR_Chr16g0786681 [Helianthus annuus]|nr:hypothetical protein HanIR_Chr16g0786681 [Helianthus annuus]